MSTSDGSACGSRQTPVLSTSTDNSSASGSNVYRPKAEFGKKHRKIIRILTVIAYVISVSTAALLLSAYYVFIWDPTPSQKGSTDSPTTLALGVTYTPGGGSSNYRQLPHNHQYAYTRNNQPFSVSQPEIKPKASRKGYHHNTKPTPHQIPTPQSLIMESLVLSSTTPQPPFRNTPPSAPIGFLVPKISK